MNQKRLWTAAGIIAVIIVAGFVLSVPHTRELPRATTSDNTAIAPTPSVTVSDTYKKGVHTLVGSVTAPDACTPVTAVASVIGDASSSPQGILLALSLPTDSGICLQLPTAVTFSTKITAPEGLPLSVTVNDIAATTTAP